MGSTPIIRSIDLGQKSYSFLSFLLFYAAFKANKLCLKIVVAFLVAQNICQKSQSYSALSHNFTTTFATRQWMGYAPTLHMEKQTPHICIAHYVRGR